MKLEIGGGEHFARGADWVNMDQWIGANIVHNLDVIPWPIADGTIDEIYSSHCIEHVHDPDGFLRECARIGAIGCTIEIRCPAPFSEMAFVADHKSIFSPQHARNMDVHFPHLYWREAKRLKLQGYHFQASEKLVRAKAELPFLAGLSDQVIMEWIPGTAHETVFKFTVRANEHYVS